MSEIPLAIIFSREEQDGESISVHCLMTKTARRKGEVKIWDWHKTDVKREQAGRGKSSEKL